MERNSGQLKVIPLDRGFPIDRLVLSQTFHVSLFRVLIGCNQFLARLIHRCERLQDVHEIDAVVYLLPDMATVFSYVVGVAYHVAKGALESPYC